MEIHGRRDYDGGEDGQWRITLEDIGCLMRYGYLEPLRAQYPQAETIPVLNQADTVELARAASGLLDEMKEEGGIAAGRLLEEYHVGYENKAKHSGRQVKLTYMLMESTACEVTEE